MPPSGTASPVVANLAACANGGESPKKPDAVAEHAEPKAGHSSPLWLVDGRFVEHSTDALADYVGATASDQ